MPTRSISHHPSCSTNKFLIYENNPMKTFEATEMKSAYPICDLRKEL